MLSVLGGEPEYLDPLSDEAPVGWIVTGYPWYAIDTPEHKAFLAAYQAKFNDYPRLGSVVGYAAMISVGEAAAQRPSPRIPRRSSPPRKAFSSSHALWPHHLSATRSPVDDGGLCRKIGLKDGKGVMVDWRYEPGERHLPADDVVKKLRPQ